MADPASIGAVSFVLSLVVLLAALAKLVGGGAERVDLSLLAAGMVVGTLHYVVSMPDRAVQISSVVALMLIGAALVRRVMRERGRRLEP